MGILPINMIPDAVSATLKALSENDPSIDIRAFCERSAKSWDDVAACGYDVTSSRAWAAAYRSAMEAA